jgi:Ser/Thr protein kinase RdoA (MazF antagonist)
LRENSVYPNVAAIAAPDAAWLVNPEELKPIRESLLQAIAGLRSLDPILLDGLCHGDLQTGNFVLDENNQVKVVDLDNICVSPIYSDGLVGLVWRGFGQEGFDAFCRRLAMEEARPACRTDATFAIAKSLIWFTAVRGGRESAEIQAQISRLVTGLTEAIAFAASLPAAKAG